MSWRRHGHIFNPADFHLLPGQCGFAQSPQALVFGEFVRVYFSTRVRDQTGQYVSHVAYADFTKDFSQVIGHSSAPVVPLGPLGSFDEHGIFPMNVLRVGTDIYGYTTGWSRRQSVAVDAAIGLVISRDQGLTFQRYSDGPVLGPSLTQPFLVGDAFVARFGDRFHMWYIHGVRWLHGKDTATVERVYKISHATSADGISWTPLTRPVIADRLGPTECQALPTVLQIDGRYHMWFCFRHATDFRHDPQRSYRLGHAWSDDLAHWTRDDTAAGLDTASAGWDSQMLCYPHVFHCDNRVLMLYNGNEFGRHGFGLCEWVP